MDTTTRPVTAATRRARNLRCSSSVPGRLTAVYGQTALLGLQAGARAFVRQRLLTEDSEPVELASAWLPLELAAGTDLASPDLLNESIRQHLQTRRKIRFDHAVEQITARHPAGEEAALLQVAQD